MAADDRSDNERSPGDRSPGDRSPEEAGAPGDDRLTVTGDPRATLARLGASESAPRQGPVPLDEKAVMALHDRFQARVEKLAAAAVPDEDELERRAAARFYVMASMEARQAPKTKDMKALAKMSAQEILRAAQRRFKDPGASIEAEPRLREAVRARQRTPVYDEIFQGRDRLYLPLQGQTKPGATQREVETLLGRHGYRDIDYVAGYATDTRHNRVKIGKALDALGKGSDGRHAAELREAYNKDPARAADKMLIVLSRHGEDVARMSTGRGWPSCMAEGGVGFDSIPDQINAGTIVAYLIRENDPEITEPLARVLFKPHHRVTGEGTILRAAARYGIKDPRLKRTAQAFLDRTYNHGKHGWFRMPERAYPDDQNPRFFNLAGDLSGWSAEAFLRAIKMTHRTREDGTLEVSGSLELPRRGITRLPDLSRCRFTGSVTLDGNPLESLAGGPRECRHFSCREAGLTSLEGAPETVRGIFDLRDNELTSLAGAPRHVGLHFRVADNRLTSLEGGPETVGGGYSCARNEMTALTGAPREIPRNFDASGNRLESLAGAPERVGGAVKLAGNRLTSLEGAPQGPVKGFACQDNALTSLAGAPAHCDGDFDVSGNPLASLAGGPERVDTLNIENTRLTSLRGAPKALRRLRARGAPLADLAGLPRRLWGNLRDNRATAALLPEAWHGSRKNPAIQTDLGDFRGARDVPAELRRPAGLARPAASAGDPAPAAKGDPKTRLGP